MADYKKMYLIMMDAAERAIELLVDAQRRCEELYIRSEQPGDAAGDADAQK